MKSSEDIFKTPAEICKVPVWYQSLSDHTFPTSFVKLRPREIQALADGETEGKTADGVISRLNEPMRAYPGNCFVFVDTMAPTDTERFEKKNGAVYSARSAWRYLATSKKIQKAAASGMVQHICIRPFRRMSRPREFRLFIYRGKLSAMSQYWLIRHFRRLEGVKQFYWEKAAMFVNDILWLLPNPTMVIDIYFTHRNQILIIDINPWDNSTSPLLLKNWDRDWDSEAGIVLMPPPIKITGNVNVSF